MAKTIANGYTDTAIGGFASNPQTLPAINLDVDYMPMIDVPGECVLTNLTSPSDQPETIRFAQRKVANVYANSDIDPSVYLPSRAGTSTLIELKETWVQTDSVDVNYRKAIPIRGGISLTLPSSGDVTADMVLAFLKRLVAASFDKGVGTSSRITALQRGVMKPKGL